MNDFLLPPGIKELIVVLQASTDYDFYKHKNNIDFVYRQKVRELHFCSGYRNIYLNGFNTSICFII